MRVFGLSICLLLTLVCSPLLAQSEPKTAEAAIAFDLRMNNIVSSPLGKSLELKAKMDELPKGSGPDMSKLVRISGALTAPETMADLQGIQGGDLPVDFFVRFEFSEAAGAQSMLQEAIDDNGGVVERDGRKYYKAPDSAGMPPGVMMYGVSDTVVEVGSEAFAFRSSPQPFTAGLKSAWENAPDEAVRLVIDLNAARNLIDEVVAQGKEQAGDNPVIGAYMDLLSKMKDLTVSMDLSGKNLLTVKSNASDADAATELKEGVDSMLGMAKMGGKAQAEQMKEFDPDSSSLLIKLLDGLNAQQASQTVTIALPRPEGFEDAVAKAIENLGGMFMGGMGPGF